MFKVEFIFYHRFVTEFGVVGIMSGILNRPILILSLCGICVIVKY